MLKMLHFGYKMEISDEYVREKLERVMTVRVRA